MDSSRIKDMSYVEGEEEAGDRKKRDPGTESPFCSQ